MEDLLNYCKKCNKEIDLYQYIAHKGYCGSQCYLTDSVEIGKSMRVEKAILDINTKIKK